MINATNIRFTELCAYFIEEYELQHKSVHTIARHRQAQRQFLAFLKEDKEIEGITLKDLKGFASQLYKRGLKETTSNTYIRSLKALWNWAASADPPYLADNCFLAMEQADEPELIPRHFDDHEFLMLLSAARKEDSRLLQVRSRAILILLYDTGIRASELCGLKLTDWKDNTLLPNWSPETPLDAKEWRPAGMIKVMGKGKKEREIGLSLATVMAIKEWREEAGLPHGRPVRGKRTRHKTQWLFCSRSFTQFTRAGLKSMCNRLGERAGLKIHPHMFRHSFSIAFIANNPDAKSVLQGVLGHSTSKMTDHYGRLPSIAAHRSHAKNSPVASLHWDD